MNQHPIVLIEPMFKWLDWLIAEHGLHLYVLTAWLSPLLIVWILRGGCWRRTVRLRIIVKQLPLPERLVVKPPPLPEIDSPKNEDSQSFAM